MAKTQRQAIDSLIAVNCQLCEYVANVMDCIEGTPPEEVEKCRKMAQGLYAHVSKESQQAWADLEAAEAHVEEQAAEARKG